VRGLVKQNDTPRHAVVRQVPEPEPGRADVVIAVEACGICGTDLTLYDSPAMLAREMDIVFPIVFGHEISGRISFVGPDVGGLAVGDLVVANPHLYCGKCYFCCRGQPGICDDRPIIGLHRSGGFAELVTVRASNVYAVRPAVPPSVAALAEPLTVGVHAARRAQCGNGNDVCIIGPGPIGLLLGVACQEAGARRVVVAGLRADALRLDVAKAIGLDTVELDGDASPRAVAADFPRNESTIIFEASGSPGGLQMALELAPKAGKVIVLGIPTEPVPVNVAALAFAEKSVIGCRAYAPLDWRQTVGILERRTDDLARLLTASISLYNHDQAFNLLRDRQAGKIVLSPGAAPEKLAAPTHH
jgi:2-desacetyl-2-hydroxyethyl bacteriochlorophyllide A dehydrogenase